MNNFEQIYLSYRWGSTPVQNEPGSNSNEELLHVSQISRTGASSSNVEYCHTQYYFHFCGGGGVSYLFAFRVF